MSTANLIKAFNKLVFQLNDDLIAVFPQESDFKLSKHTFELLIKLITKKYLNIGPHCLMHKEALQNRDENFLLQPTQVSM